MLPRIIFFSICMNFAVNHVVYADQSLAIYKDLAVLSENRSIKLDDGTKSYKLDGIIETALGKTFSFFLSEAQINTFYQDENGDVQFSATAPKPKNYSANITYGFQGLTWGANYSVLLSNDYDSAKMMGWFVLKNETNADFKDVRLALIEGESPIMKDQIKHEQSAAGTPIKGLPLYQYPTVVDLKPQHSKRILWFQSNNLDITKEYRIVLDSETLDDLDGKSLYPKFETWVTLGGEDEGVIDKNLPSGVLTIFQASANKTHEIIGHMVLSRTNRDDIIQFRVPHERHIDDGPYKGPRVTSKLEQTEYRKLSENTTENGYKLRIKNPHSRSLTIKVVLGLPFKDWAITRESLPHENVGHKSVYWIIDVPSKSEVDLKYRLNVTKG